jgi:hypothetical protein
MLTALPWRWAWLAHSITCAQPQGTGWINKAGSLSQALMERPNVSQFLIHCEWPANWGNYWNDDYLKASNIKIIRSKYIRSKPNQLLA